MAVVAKYVAVGRTPATTAGPAHVVDAVEESSILVAAFVQKWKVALTVGRSAVAVRKRVRFVWVFHALT